MPHKWIKIESLKERQTLVIPSFNAPLGIVNTITENIEFGRTIGYYVEYKSPNGIPGMVYFLEKTEVPVEDLTA